MRPQLLSFSGGRSSAKLVYDQIQRYGVNQFVIQFCNTGKEKEETLEFVQECNDRWRLNVVWLEWRPKKEPVTFTHSVSGEIITLEADPRGFTIVDFATASRKGEPFEGVIAYKGYKYLPNVIARFCTGDLKAKPSKRHMQSLGHKHWDVLMGIRYDEGSRWGKLLQNTQKEPYSYVLPMVDDELTLADVTAFWRNQPFDLRLEPHQGNCDHCFLKSRKKRVQLIREDPKDADWWERLEERTGAQFDRKISVKRQRELAATELTPNLFVGDIDYPCLCNAD